MVIVPLEAEKLPPLLTVNIPGIIKLLVVVTVAEAPTVRLLTLLTLPEKTVAPAPLNVKSKSAQSIAPLKVRVPASTPMETALANVIAPDMELAPDTFLKAPAFKIPVPFKIIASATPVISP